ncbi:PaaI family thioesterase [Variovorax sp. YR752]|uniref:PaaI family thioesterase n=1 Tax=Variovorax sp. YR752 TaxID=1884383 RepID=UPI003137A7CF
MSDTAFVNEAPGLLFGLPMPMARSFALRGEAIGDERARVRMPYNADHANSRGDVHGGAIAVLFDCTLASAVRSHAPTAFGVVTVDITVHYTAPCAGDVIATAVCERRGRAMCFARGEARNADGELLAMATGTFKLVPRTASPSSESTP